jgi:molybdenum cofactor synthesis domain-containing protein
MSFRSEDRQMPIVPMLDAKLSELRSCLARVGCEAQPVWKCAHRVLAEPLRAFRDSPAIDVSAMDGYAIRIDDLDGSVLPISATVTAGSTPVAMVAGSAVRVFTGGSVPSGAQCVVRREDCSESESYVSIDVPKESLSVGMNIRRQGENAKRGDLILATGSMLTPSRFAGATTFAESSTLQVYRKVRIGIINTGDELRQCGDPIEPWQIRDSNGPFLETSLAHHPWIECTRSKVHDDLEAIQIAIASMLTQCDAILLTGGVSMGDTDHVPDALLHSGCRIVFHRIPIRPGKPMLGGVGPQGQLVVGLPGNPLSVAVTFRRFAWQLIQHIAGVETQEQPPLMPLQDSDPKTIDLLWFRLVKRVGRGELALVSSQGSGDIASLIESDGFVEVAPRSPTSGALPFYAW